MRRLGKILERFAWNLGLFVLLILLVRPAIGAYEWLAWNVLTKDFQAVCTSPRELTGYDVDVFHVIEGPYTAEFWEYLRVAFDRLGEDLEPEWAMWQEDGTLRVPVGFDFEPVEKDAMRYLRHDRRPRERSHVLASYATNQIFKDRLMGRVDLSQYEHLAYSWLPDSFPPANQPNTCGFMEEVITVDGSLAPSSRQTHELNRLF
ncbi:hypothetical protein KAJ83_17095 [Marivibrio halodurans]|uniref:Uncharacterized protein n=1 Tax=Marivibrio halodurans TaxID=2039722 RepID=A0A8J7V5C2_9PROT|nr:hypothetical protein [Marivibrio halodurans]MBP5858739.1 hypothetical protein [Marivibrio halodurans]